MRYSKEYIIRIILKVTAILLIVMPLKKYEIAEILYIANDVGLTVLDVIALGIFLISLYLVIKNPRYKDSDDILFR